MAYSPIQLKALELISIYYVPGESCTIIPYSDAYSHFEHRAKDVFKSLEDNGSILYISDSFESYKLKVYPATFENYQNDCKSPIPELSGVVLPFPKTSGWEW